MKKIIIIFITVFFSCNKRSHYNHLIVEGDSTFWNYYKNQSQIPSDCYLFKKNGECIRYFYTKYDSLFRFSDEDVEYPNTWQILGDSIIEIRGFKRRILYITSDSMKLLNPKLNDTLIFKRKYRR